MEITFPALVVGVFLGVLIVVIGVFIGIWMTHGRMQAERAHRMEAERAQQMIAGLLQWANAVKGDVSHYSHHMADHSRKLQRSEQDAKEDGEDNPPAGADTDDLLTEMELSNQQLQQRLDAAEAAYAEQSGQLESYLSQAHTDPLTGLPNRRAFNEELARRFSEFNRKGTPLTLIMFDIDHFKSLNDEFGHLTGDEVLVRTAGDLSQCVRDIDTVARFGGEEFALILPDTPLQDALLPTERARLAVAMDVVEYDGREVGVTISCGVAELQPGEDVTAVLQRADEALYASKEGGRNCTHYHDGATPVRVELDGLLPAGPPKQRTMPRPTGLIPGQFTEVCQDLRKKLVEHLQ